jgi:hypothetical protein
MRRVIVLAVLALTLFSFTYGCGNAGTDTTSGSPDSSGAGTIDHSGQSNTGIDTGSSSGFGTDTTTISDTTNRSRPNNNPPRDTL